MFTGASACIPSALTWVYLKALQTWGFCWGNCFKWEEEHFLLERRLLFPYPLLLVGRYVIIHLENIKPSKSKEADKKGKVKPLDLQCCLTFTACLCLFMSPASTPHAGSMWKQSHKGNKGWFSPAGNQKMQNASCFQAWKVLPFTCKFGVRALLGVCGCRVLCLIFEAGFRHKQCKQHKIYQAWLSPSLPHCPIPLMWNSL